ncbi:MAG: hypothetical protein ACRERD_08765 [Candidatus Binatia bacterium]
MNTAREKVRWLLEFVGIDLDRLRPGDLLNLEEGMRRFLGDNAEAASQVQDKDILNNVQSKASLVLYTLAEQHSPPYIRATRVAGFKQDLTIDARPSRRIENFGTRAKRDKEATTIIINPQGLDGLVFGLSGPGRYDLTVLASQLQPAFEFAIGRALAAIEVDRFRLCYAPKPRQRDICRKLFFAAHKRQEFCSSQCKNRAALKRFRQEHKTEEQERGRANYEKRVKQKLGPNVRINKRTKTRQRKEK